MADEGKAPFDYEQLAIFLQKRYHALQQLKKITDDFIGAVEHDDDVSAGILLDMRNEQIVVIDGAWQEILQMGETSPEAHDLIGRLMLQEPDLTFPENDWENRIVQMRRNALELIDAVKRQDRRMNEHLNKDRSFYFERENSRK